MKTVWRLILFFAIFGGAPAGAQAPPPMPRIGVLIPGLLHDRDEQRDFQAFFQGFKELGYVPGQNIVFEFRAAERKTVRLPQLAAELVGLKVSAIVAVGTTAISVAIKATKTIPIVMVSGGNPVGRGFVKSSSVPGGNVTGLSSAAEGDEGKRLALLKEVFPWVKRVLLLNADRRRSRVENYLRRGKELLAFELFDVHSPKELEHVLATISPTATDALITVRNAFTLRHAEEITGFALKNRLPAIYESRKFVEAGGVMSYGVNYTASWYRAAFYVDKILNGMSPTVLPIGPPQFELVVNLRTARKMGHTIPPEILLEANEVLK